MKLRWLIRVFLKYVVPLLISFVVGTAWHEIMGHGLVGIVCGGHVEYVEILGVRVWPRLCWQGWPAYYGCCDVQGIPSDTGNNVMSLAGSLSTWCVAVVAAVLLWVPHWPAGVRVVLYWFSIWWIDLLTYTLPSWGIPHSIVRGTLYAEPYEAAVALGIPGKAFQTFVVVTSVVLCGSLVIRLGLDRRRRSRGAPAHSANRRRPPESPPTACGRAE